MPLVPVQFGPDSGPSRSVNASAGGLENCFIESAPDAKTQYAIYSTPGLKLFADTTNPLGCRGGIVVNESVFYVVFGETLYKVNSGGVYTALGIIYGTDNVSMAYNKATPVEVAIAAGGRRYILSSDVITEIAHPTLPPPNPINVTYLDGYFVWFYTNGEMYQSAINDGTTYDALDFKEAEARQDKTRSGGILSDRLINFGSESIEFFYNSAPDEGFSFSPQAGAQINRGILDRYCWAEFDNTVAWIDQEGIVVRGESTIGRVIGTYPVHKDIEDTIRKEQQADIVVSTWALAGHEMFQIWSPDWCWTYDASTQKWFRRKSQDRDTWAGRHVFHVFNKTLIGDESSGILYEQDVETYDENGKQLIRSMVSNYVHNGPGKARHNALFLDVETGVGNDEGPAIAERFDFDAGVEGFVPSQDCTLSQSAGKLIVTHTGAGEVGFQIGGLDFVGKDYTTVKARVRRTAGTGGWRGALFPWWSPMTAPDGAIASANVATPTPTDETEWTEVSWDLTELGSGTSAPTGWVANNIAGFRMDLGQNDATAVWQVDWIEVSGPNQSSEDVDPEMMVSWSDDGGHTYTGNRVLSMGEQGEYGTRIRTNRLGVSKDKGRVYKVDFSAARPFVFIAGNADLTGLTV